MNTTQEVWQGQSVKLTLDIERMGCISILVQRRSQTSLAMALTGWHERARLAHRPARRGNRWVSGFGNTGSTATIPSAATQIFHSRSDPATRVLLRIFHSSACIP